MATFQKQYDSFEVNGQKFMTFCLGENVLQAVKDLLQGAELPPLPPLPLEEELELFGAPTLVLREGESRIAWRVGETAPTIRWWAVVEEDGTVRCHPIWDKCSSQVGGTIAPPLPEVVVGRIDRPVVKIDRWPMQEFVEDALAILDRRIEMFRREIAAAQARKRELMGLGKNS